MGVWLKDFRFATRMLLRSPVSMAVVVITLALGIGANTAVFSVINAVLLRPLPYDAPDDLVLALSSRPKEGISFEAVSYLNYSDWRDRNRVFSDIHAISDPRAFTLTGTDQPEHLLGEYVTAGLFEMMGIKAIVGRTFLPTETAKPGAEPVVLISDSLWQRRFDASAAVVGRKINLNDQVFSIVGVLAPTYRGLHWDPVDVWVPLTMASTFLGSQYLEQREWTWHLALARLAPETTREQASAEMNRLAEALEEQHPVTNKGSRVHLMPLREYFFVGLDARLYLLLLFSGLVLLICCLNVASLILTHLTSRSREVAIRMALGAGRGQLIRLLSLQTCLVALLGGALGVALAYGLSRWVVALSDIRPATFVDAYVDGSVLAITLGVSLLTGLLFGTLPILLASRRRFQEALQEGYRGTTKAGFGGRLRGAFVVLQVAAAVCLLFAASLVSQSFQYLRSADLGFEVGGLTTFDLNLASQRYQDEARQANFVRRLAAEIEPIAGLIGASFVGPLAPPQVTRLADVTVEDRLLEASDTAWIRTFRSSVYPGYFETLRIPLLAGRDFTLQDTQERDAVAIISQPLASLVWPEDPVNLALGRRLKIGRPDDGTDDWITIVGVVPEVMNRGVAWDATENLDVYFPLLQQPVPSLTLVARANGDPVSLAPALRRALERLDPDLPVYGIPTMRDRVAQLAEDPRFSAVLMALYALTALVMAMVGIYGVVASSVGQRQHEFGIRVALGADRPKVLGLALRQGALWLALGLGLGLVILPFEGTLLTKTGQLIGVRLLDPWTFLVVLPCLGIVSLLACYIPAQRATKVDPLVVLRQD